ncbi:MAG: fibrobacter succinogenes major paralogous domain-containing protein [Fibromonadales bacterium]|nr:fibrobacter succinogenes major paralogous domain-containing protein [Fibromonadales bacterium]
MRLYTAMFIFMFFAISAHGQQRPVAILNTVDDERDGKKYKTVKIGSQIWMAENLNYEASDSKCYDNKPENCAKYGRLYNWQTANTACPKGWHLPSKAEWAALTSAVGGAKTEGLKLKAKSGWKSNGNGTDDFGFSALPGGNGYSDGYFNNVGNYGNWWSSSEYNSDNVYYRSIYYILEIAGWDYSSKSFLLSVRCLQD